ncbi:MAG TPA: hypothetical protein VIM73_07735, partial [Polyangiaceae bacterium]
LGLAPLTGQRSDDTTATAQQSHFRSSQCAVHAENARGVLGGASTAPVGALLNREIHARCLSVSKLSFGLLDKIGM